MKPWTAAALAVALLGTTPAWAAPGGVLQMDAKTQGRLGVNLATLQAAYRTTTLAAFARGVDPGPLAQLDSDLATARAALAASQAEAKRTQALAADQTVSAQVAEAAQSQARQDALKVQLLRQRIGLEWGPGVAKLSDGARGKLIAEVASGRAALLRLDSAVGLPLTGGGSVTVEVAPDEMASATVLGPTRAADPRLQSTGLLAVIRGSAALRLASGAVAPATLASGAGLSGVVIPRAALLRSGGQTFVFVRRDATSFERRAVVGAAADPDGVFVAKGFKPGEVVVTTGAAQLWAAQTGPGPGKAD